MIIESTQIQRLPVQLATGEKVGKIDSGVWDGQKATLMGFQVAPSGLLKKAKALPFDDVLSLSRHEVVIDSPDSLQPDVKTLEQIYQSYGPIISVAAKTESGRKLGKIADVLIEAETGYIVRFYIRNLLHERLISRRFLVSITPKAVIFKDIVDQPVFDQAANAESATAGS